PAPFGNHHDRVQYRCGVYKRHFGGERWQVHDDALIVPVGSQRMGTTQDELVNHHGRGWEKREPTLVARLVILSEVPGQNRLVDIRVDQQGSLASICRESSKVAGDCVLAVGWQGGDDTDQSHIAGWVSHADRTHGIAQTSCEGRM